MVSVKHINIAVASEQQALDMDPITVATPSQPPPLDAIVAVRERGREREGVHAEARLVTPFVTNFVPRRRGCAASHAALTVHPLCDIDRTLCVTLTQGD